MVAADAAVEPVVGRLVEHEEVEAERVAQHRRGRRAERVPRRATPIVAGGARQCRAEEVLAVAQFAGERVALAGTDRRRRVERERGRGEHLDAGEPIRTAVERRRVEAGDDDGGSWTVIAPPAAAAAAAMSAMAARAAASDGRVGVRARIVDRRDDGELQRRVVVGAASRQALDERQVAGHDLAVDERGRRSPGRARAAPGRARRACRRRSSSGAEISNEASCGVPASVTGTVSRETTGGTSPSSTRPHGRAIVDEAVHLDPGLRRQAGSRRSTVVAGVEGVDGVAGAVERRCGAHRGAEVTDDVERRRPRRAGLDRVRLGGQRERRRRSPRRRCRRRGPTTASGDEQRRRAESQEPAQRSTASAAARSSCITTRRSGSRRNPTDSYRPEGPLVVDGGVHEAVAEPAGVHPVQRVEHERAAVAVALVARARRRGAAGSRGRPPRR